LIKRLVTFALGVPGFVLIAVATLILGGLYAFSELQIEAYPNPVPPLVETIAQPPGWSAEEVERYITIPLEVGLSGMAGLDHIRSQSLFGLSDIKCYFNWGTNYWQVRQEVINRLQFVQLPSGVQAQISPWNGVGEVFRYFVRGKGYALRDLKAVEDFTLERQWKQVPGVIDVTSFGGETKEYHVEVDPYRMRARGVSLAQLQGAIANANANTGGSYVTIGEQSHNVRSLGLISSLTDVSDIVVIEAKDKNGNPTGVPIRVRDVANVVLGHAPRLGVIGKKNGCPLHLETKSWWERLWEPKEERARRELLDNPVAQRRCDPQYIADEDDVVQGVILMRYGEHTRPTLEGIYKRIEFIRENHLLPPGMEIVPYYDRDNLVKVTSHTVLENLLMGMLLVMGVQLLFLGNLRAALITSMVIPLSLLVAFAGMVLTGTSANLLSIGAVDFGIVVDSSVIMMENIFKHLGRHGRGTMKERIQAAAGEVGGPMFVSTIIIGAAFIPLFTLTGVSSVLFTPMARTYAFAIGGAILLAVFMLPVLTQRFLRHGVDEHEDDSRVMRFLNGIYNPLFEAILRRPRASLALLSIPIFAAFVLFPFLGRDFMPKLEEGNFWIRSTFPVSISLEKSFEYSNRMRKVLAEYPEVLSVVSEIGRPDDGTDVTGLSNVEFFCPLLPFGEWPRGLTKEKLTDIVRSRLEREFPGVTFNFSQYISDNVEEAVSGVKGENSIKIVGPELEVNEAKAGEIMKVLEKVTGITDIGTFRTLGQPEIRIVPDRTICSRYGINPGDINNIVQGLIGDLPVTQVYEGEKFFALTTRLQEPYRDSLEAIRQIPVQSPDGNFLPLGQLASITREEGPLVVYREDGQRFSPVKFSVRGRDLAGAIGEAKTRIAQEVKLPYDTHLIWSGEIAELDSAEARLLLIVPITLIIISFLIFFAVKSIPAMLIVLADIPLACTGGVLALLVTGVHFSQSAAIGFVSVFGIAVQDALLLVTYFQQLHFKEGMSLEEAARVASQRRFRPVLMTTLTAILGLLPAALSNGIGSQSQKPLAIVVIGGALNLLLLTRLVQPPMCVIAFSWLERRRARRRGVQEAT
jgi:cobalt-zinc-cadmium resistance protein CzcA